MIIEAYAIVNFMLLLSLFLRNISRNFFRIYRYGTSQRLNILAL